MRKTKKQKAFDLMQLLKDANGDEFLYYTGVFGPVNDYSPWTIKEYKQYKKIDIMEDWKMIITYRERTFFNKYKCIDTIKKIHVIKKAFTQGELVYFKKNNFDYFVIENNFIIDIMED